MIKKINSNRLEVLMRIIRVAYNDVDLCFSVYEKGYYNVDSGGCGLISL